MTPTCKCDYVEVQETLSDGTSALIGKYCMGAAYPKGDIRTHGNNMTVIFRSDYLIGEPGFKARYEAIQVTGKDQLQSCVWSTFNVVRRRELRMSGVCSLRTICSKNSLETEVKIKQSKLYCTPVISQLKLKRVIC